MKNRDTQCKRERYFAKRNSNFVIGPRSKSVTKVDSSVSVAGTPNIQKVVMQCKEMRPTKRKKGFAWY